MRLAIAWSLVFLLACTAHAAPSRELSEEDGEDSQLSEATEHTVKSAHGSPHIDAKPSLSPKSAEAEESTDKAFDDRTLSAEIAGQHALRSPNGTYLRHHFDLGWTVGFAPKSLAYEHWTIEDHGGKISLKPSVSRAPGGGYLYAKGDGGLRWDKGLWTPVKHEDGSWSFRSEQGRWLSADSKGLLLTRTEIDTWAHFWLEPKDAATTVKPSPSPSPKSVEAEDSSEEEIYNLSLSAEIAGKQTLKSSHGTYIRHVENERMSGFRSWKVDTARQCMACEQWTIVDRQGKVALQPYCHSGIRGSPSAGYLRAHLDGSVRVASTDDESALWTPIKREDGSISFRSRYGALLSADRNTGAVYTVTENIDEWENFWLGSWCAEAASSSSSSSSSTRESNAMSMDQFVDLLKGLDKAFGSTGDRTSDGKADSTTRDDTVASHSSAGKTDDSTTTDKEDEPEETEETESHPTLSVELTGKRTLKSWYGSYLRAWANSSDWFVGAASQVKECEQWYIEDHKGKVALKAYCSDKYLRSNEGRYVDLGDKPMGHEMWTPVKNGDGSWSFKGHHGTWLRAQPHGRISLQTGLNGGDEKFWLGMWTGKFDEIEGARSLKSTHGTFLRAAYCASDIDSTNVDMAGHLKACEKWQIKRNGEKVSLMPVAEPGKYLRSYADGSVGLSKKQEDVEERELWTPLKHADGSWSLKSAHGKLLSAAANGTVTTVTDNEDSENFWIKALDD